MFKCKRCGYETVRKKHLEKHLHKQKTCSASLSDIDISTLLKEIAESDPLKNGPNYSKCRHCDKPIFKTNISRHEKTCKLNVNATSNTSENDELSKLKEEIAELKEFCGISTHAKSIEDQLEDKSKQIKNLQIELEFYKGKKNEPFYQAILENHFNASHKTLRSGITDITTDKMHAEIKAWDCWKESIGQLISYNTVDPREELHVYLFGKYSPTSKQTAIEVFSANNFKVFDCILQEKTLRVINMTDNSILFEHVFE
jgi:hypothetical protein